MLYFLRYLATFCQYVGVSKMTDYRICGNMNDIAKIGGENMAPYPLAVSEYIREKMRTHGITQQALAKRLKRSQAYVSDRYLDKKSWTLQDLDEIAKMLGYSGMMALLNEMQGMSGNTS